MLVRVPCICGKTLSIDPRCATTHFTCPNCGRLHAIPAVPPDDQGAPPLLEADTAHPGDDRELMWIPVIGGLFAALLVCVILLWVLLADLPSGGTAAGAGGSEGTGRGEVTARAGEGAGGSGGMALGDRSGRGSPGSSEGADGSSSADSRLGEEAPLATTPNPPGAAEQTPTRAQAPRPAPAAPPSTEPATDQRRVESDLMSKSKAKKPEKRNDRPPVEIGHLGFSDAKKPEPKSESESKPEIKLNGKASVAVSARSGGGRAAGAKYGATRESEAAVDLGLAWLACVQRPDGNWNLQSEMGCLSPNGQVRTDEQVRRGVSPGPVRAPQHEAPPGPDIAPQFPGRAADGPFAIGITGLGTLAFLGAGNTPNEGKYAQTVRMALDWLVKAEGANGQLNSGNFYEQGPATMALCEACAMDLKDTRYRNAAQRAVDYIVAQMGPQGGYGYNGPGVDVHVTSFQIMALKAARLAKLKVPDQTFQRLRTFLDNTLNKDGTTDYGLGMRGPTPTRTAVGLYCRLFLDYGNKNQTVILIANRIRDVEDVQAGNVFYTYSATYGMFQMGGNYWPGWNEKFRDAVISLQDKTEGPLKGSWPPDMHAAGNRVCTTAVYVMSLEVYYRYLRVYN